MAGWRESLQGLSFNDDSGLGLSLIGFRQRFLEHLIDRNKDIDKECGYPEILTPAYCKSFYDREGIAKRVVNIFPDECWSEEPEIYETSDNGTTTDFEQDWVNLNKKFQLCSFLHRADRTSGIGTFGLILLGIDDGKQFIEPVDGVPLDGTNPFWLDPKGQRPFRQRRGIKKIIAPPTHRLLYMRVFDESAVSVNKFETDITSPRYGQPLLYNVNFIQYGVNTEVVQPVAPMPTSPTPVHWTRVIHLADCRESSEVYGVPRMAPVVNRLVDLRKLLGSCAEMFWKGGFPGISFEVNPELQSVAQLDPELMRKEFEDYSRGLQRYLALVGVSAKSLAVQVADPSNHFKTLMQAVGASLGIPYRVLIGSEEAKLAADQDASAWMTRIASRQSKYCTPFIIWPFILRLMIMGILRPIKDINTGISVDWADLHSPSDTEKAEIADTLMDALSKYVTGGCDVILPPKMFFKIMMNMDDEEVEEAIAAMKQWVGQMNSGGAVASALHPPEPDQTQPTPSGGAPLGPTGKGAASETNISNFPNGGDPAKQAQAGQKGQLGKGLTSPLRPGQQAAPPLKSPQTKKAGGTTPSIKKSTKTSSVQQNADLGYSTVDSRTEARVRQYSSDPVTNAAFRAGALAKRTGLPNSVPSQYARNVKHRVAFKRGFRSTTRNRMP